MMVLNDTQRAQIAENRAAALARRAAKQQQEQQQQLDDYQEVLSKALLEDKVEVLSKALLEDKVEAEPNSGAAKSDDGKTLAELFLGEPDDKTKAKQRVKKSAHWSLVQASTHLSNVEGMMLGFISVYSSEVKPLTKNFCTVVFFMAMVE